MVPMRRALWLDFNQAIELNPQDANAYYNRGLASASASKGDFQRAAADYERARELKLRSGIVLTSDLLGLKVAKLEISAR